MASKSMVQTFSYPVNKAEMIEKAAKIAKADGVSFSEFLVSLVEEEVRKKVKGEESPNPLNLPSSNNTYVLNPKKSLESENMSLDQWVNKVKTIHSLPELGKIKGYHS